MEILASLSPDWILSPSSLQSDLQSKYETLNSDWAFLNLRSVPGMYQSIEELGVIFDREQQARELTDEYQEFYQNFQEEIAGKEHPKVLILMGLPGSYVIATEKSYIGSLAALAGAENVYEDQGQEFLTVNTEDMKTKEPDIILRAAHALPDQVAEMFAEDFKTNDIWKHFQAVKDGKVYDLPYEQFGMSATFAYQDALETLKNCFIPNRNKSRTGRRKRYESRYGAETEKVQANLDFVCCDPVFAAARIFFGNQYRESFRKFRSAASRSVCRI